MPALLDDTAVHLLRHLVSAARNAALDVILNGGGRGVDDNVDPLGSAQALQGAIDTLIRSLPTIPTIVWTIVAVAAVGINESDVTNEALAREALTEQINAVWDQADPQDVKAMVDVCFWG